jgi:hypothetical protein
MNGARSSSCSAALHAHGSLRDARSRGKPPTIEEMQKCLMQIVCFFFA